METLSGIFLSTVEMLELLFRPVGTTYLVSAAPSMAETPSKLPMATSWMKICPVSMLLSFP
jgi:hypothetical protein